MTMAHTKVGQLRSVAFILLCGPLLYLTISQSYSLAHNGFWTFPPPARVLVSGFVTGALIALAIDQILLRVEHPAPSVALSLLAAFAVSLAAVTIVAGRWGRLPDGQVVAMYGMLCMTVGLVYWCIRSLCRRFEFAWWS